MNDAKRAADGLRAIDLCAVVESSNAAEAARQEPFPDCGIRAVAYENAGRAIVDAVAVLDQLGNEMNMLIDGLHDAQAALVALSNRKVTAADVIAYAAADPQLNPFLERHRELETRSTHAEELCIKLADCLQRAIFEDTVLDEEELCEGLPVDWRKQVGAMRKKMKERAP